MAVLPLIPRNEDLVGKARALYEELRLSVVADYDESGQIGRRYRRQDAIGTPYGLTFDEQTLAFELGLAIHRTREALERDPASDSAIGRLIDLVEIARKLQPSFDLSSAQDLVWTVVNETSSKLARTVSEGGRIGAWRELAKVLRIRVSVSR